MPKAQTNLAHSRTIASAALVISLAAFLSGCGGSIAPAGSSSESSFSPVQEKTFCSTSTSVSGGVTVTSSATFKARSVSISGLGAAGAAQAIKYAEVQILDSAGNAIQCGTTDVNGAISLMIPSTAGTYTLSVNSRADNNYYKVSVLNNPSSNTYYSVTASFTLAGGETTTAVTLPAADVTGTAIGGAFNIMNQVYLANEYLRNNSTCASLGGICTQFTVAPKIAVYWTLGESPAKYYGSPGSGLSFYLMGDDYSVGLLRGLYIGGGVLGDSTCADTDHFDNSVILHEYGHFLENAYGYSNSPGGSHDANSIIDPRLAWSEGWANFVQGAIRSDSYYRDTIGNITCTSGSTYLGVELNLATATSGQDRMLAGTTSGEGVFREVSVARMLYDAYHSASVNAGFGIIWQVFSSTTNGFGDSNVRFRNIGKFNEFLLGLLTTYDSAKASSFSTYVSNEFQLSNQNEYALVVTPQSSSACTRSITGSANVVSVGRTASNLLRSNDFFAVYYNGSSFTNVSLKYSGTGTPSDLDLYVYKEDYTYGTAADIAVQSARFYPESGGTGLETVSFSGLAAGWYLIDVKVEASSIGTAATYYLETSTGVRLCP